MKLLIKWKVISTVCAKWRELADLLEIDPAVTAAIEVKHNGDTFLACSEILMRWLRGEGSTPSWEELIDNFDHGLSFKAFSDQLRSKLGEL